MLLNRNQKKDLVIKLYEDGKTTRDIAKEVRISLRDIGAILKEHNKEPEPEKTKSNRARAFEFFMQGKDTIEVLTLLDLEYYEVRRYYGEYLSLKNMTEFIDFYNKNQRFIPFLLKIIEKIKQYELFEVDIDAFFYCLNYYKNFQGFKMQLQHKLNCLTLKITCLEDEG